MPSPSGMSDLYLNYINDKSYLEQIDFWYEEPHLSAQLSPNTVDLEALIKSGGYSMDYSNIINSLNNAKIPSKGFPSNISQFENKEAKLITTSTETGNINTLFNKLWVTNISMQDMERVQITETFGNPIIKFFDKKTPVYGFSGLVLETATSKPKVPEQYYWGTALQQYYENEIRGTKLAENKRLAILHVANHAFLGFLLNLNIREIGVHNTETFTFSMVVTRHEFIRDTTNMYSIEQYVRDVDIKTFKTVQEKLADETTNYKNKIKQLQDNYNDPSFNSTELGEQITASLQKIKSLQTTLLTFATNKSKYDDS